ncbi:hypothetical protein L2E82_09087 [Cichorium intybus]|uniref:Uncharacterized protein n=1 Tax=Cichorium intybus TaxID=13427 RepID=A0ACB9G8G5_CICIN|nr:hypothetical protein L2E82_09087 [Cichorium intybus]
MVQSVKKGTSDDVNVWRGFVNGIRNFEKHILVIGIYRKNYHETFVRFCVMDFVDCLADRQRMAMVFTSSPNNPSYVHSVINLHHTVYGIRYNKNKKQIVRS